MTDAEGTIAQAAGHRARVLAALGGAAAVIPAGPLLFQGRDTEVRFRQDRDFWYLTAFREPDAVAVLSPHAADGPFTLFVRPRDPEREAWNGPRAGVEGARERWGADAAYPSGELSERLRELLEPAERIFWAWGRHPALDRRMAELLAAFRVGRARSGRGPLETADSDLLLAPLRQVKTPWELDRLRAAAALSVAGQRVALAGVRPGVGEWEVEALVESTFRSGGAAGPAFPSIVGSGPNATVLHHVANDRRARAGELLLLDAGAELNMYCGDMTRTVPVSGRFSPPQRAVYDVVLAAAEAATAVVRPGSDAAAVHDAAVSCLVAGMLDLGLLRGGHDEAIETGSYKRFFPHQTSHWLGLDVHDVGPYRTADGASVPLLPGMVLTVEPGIYVPADAEGVRAELRGIGVRIEDDLVVTESGHEVLTRGVPVAPDEVEALVGRADPCGWGAAALS